MKWSSAVGEHLSGKWNNRIEQVVAQQRATRVRALRLSKPPDQFMKTNPDEIAEVQRRALWLVERQQLSDPSFNFDLLNLQFIDDWIDNHIKSRGSFLSLTELAYENNTMLRTFGAFVGESLVRAQHGRWQHDEGEPYIIGDNGQGIFRPFEYVRRRFSGSSELSLAEELARTYLKTPERRRRG